MSQPDTPAKRGRGRPRKALSQADEKLISDVKAELEKPPAARMVAIVPSKGRPQNAARAIEAWLATRAPEVAGLTFVVEESDVEAYAGAIREVFAGEPESWVQMLVTGAPGYAHGANWAARHTLDVAPYPVHMAVQGDDHVPGTDGWAQRYCDELDALVAELGVGMVYGDDGLRGEKLCTEWAVSWSWVGTLNRIIPALVGHLYSDTSVLDLAKAAGCARYLPDVSIRHMHPLASVDGKPAADWDPQYRRVNSDAQRRDDHRIYLRWSTRPEQSDKAGLVNQAAKLRALRPVTQQ